MTNDPKLTTVQTIGFLRTQIANYHIIKRHDSEEIDSLPVYTATPVCTLDNGGYSAPVEITVNCPSIFEYRPGEIEVRVETKRPFTPPDYFRGDYAGNVFLGSD